MKEIVEFREDYWLEAITLEDLRVTKEQLLDPDEPILEDRYPLETPLDFHS